MRTVCLQLRTIEVSRYGDKERQNKGREYHVIRSKLSLQNLVSHSRDDGLHWRATWPSRERYILRQCSSTVGTIESPTIANKGNLKRINIDITYIAPE